MVQSNEERIKFANDEVIGKGNLRIVNEIFAANYVAHTGGKDYNGHQFVRRFIGQLRSAIPDIRVVKVEILLHSGDTIVWQRTLSGTHKANMMGIPPSGQKIEWIEMVVTRFDGEKIAEEWVVSELAGRLLSKPPCA